jgi:hypothetical protein
LRRVAGSKDEGELEATVDDCTDWNRFLALAQRHRVLALVHVSLSGVRGVPMEVRVQLRDYARMAGQHGLRALLELARLSRQFEESGIPWLPLKGPAIAALYPEPIARESVDIDLLVPPRFVSEASMLLVESGYESWESLHGGQEVIHRWAHYARNFTRADPSGITVDLHWGLSARYISLPFPREWLWQELQTVTVPGLSVPALRPETLLLLLCFHGAKYRPWDRLKLVCDIARLLNSLPDLDWRLVLARAGQIGGQRIVFLGLMLAESLFGPLPIPEWVHLELRSREQELGRLRDSLRRYLLDPRPEPPHPLLGIDFHLRVRERLRDRLRLRWWRLVSPTPRDWGMARLPAALAPAYYVLRCLRLATYLVQPRKLARLRF